MRVRRRDVRFVGLAAQLSLPAHVAVMALVVAVNLGVAPILLMLALAAISIPVLRLIAVILFAHLLVSVVLAPFLGMAFPPIAIDAPGSPSRRSMRLSRGHRLRLGTFAFLASLSIIPLVCAPYVAGYPDSATLFVLQSAIGSFIGFVAEALVSGVFAVAFQRITAHLNKGTYGVFD